jgi:diacylglycerol kinase (ATP)
MAEPMAFSSSACREVPALVLVNPIAGGGRAGVYSPRIQRLFEAIHFPAEFVLTESAEELEVRAKYAIARGHKLLLAMGGDGTFQGLANAAFGADVVLGVLPAGGGNDFAAALGLPRDPVAAAHAVVRGQPRWVDLVRARTGDGRERLYVGGGGVGLDAEAARYASGVYRGWPGTLRYMASALRALRRFAPLMVRAEFPGSDLPAVEAKILLAGILNTPTYGAGLRLAPGAEIHDGLLNAVMVEELSLFEVLALLSQVAQSGNVRIPQVKRFCAPRVRLTADRHCSFHGDGEILGPAPVEVEVVPRAVRVLAPILR